MTLCPSWENDEVQGTLQGPSDYLQAHHSHHPTGIVYPKPVTLSVLMDFTEQDTLLTVMPFVQTIIEIAKREQFPKIALHAPNGCWPILFALGFRTRDAATPTLAVQENFILNPETTYPVGYDIHQPMINISSNDEFFIHIDSLRLFHLELYNLHEIPVYLDGQEPTSWQTLLNSHRYLSQTSCPKILPEFHYLPYPSYLPSFSALREREITGRLPPNQLRYETVPTKAADFDNLGMLQWLGATDEVFQPEDETKSVRLRYS
jgi:hypothetical protein